MTAFVSGVQLGRDFYDEVVEPLVRPYPHAAALLGWGSDVLGYDTLRSTDHGWGPRLQVFVDSASVDDVRAVVDAGLPATFRDLPVVFGWDDVTPRHHVEVTTLSDWLRGQLGVAADRGMSTSDWLLTPQQLLLGVVRGAVYADRLGDLTRVRADLAWYPRDVWLWLLACGWQRLAQEEHLVGRAAEVGDDLGSRLLAGQLVRDVMRLAFLLERTYAPYAKWLGTAFAGLQCASRLLPALERTVNATAWPEREAGLVSAYELLGTLHNRTGVTPHVDPTVRHFHDRPFLVLDAGRFVTACFAEVHDEWLRSQPLVGSVDQFGDSTDLLSDPELPRRLRNVYRDH